MAIYTYLSIITLKVNGLNALIKRQCSWIDKKIRNIYILSKRDPPQNERHAETKSKGMEKDISWKWKWKITGIAILVSGNIDFKTK